MSAYRENGRRGDVFENATESVTAQAASGDPLEALSPTDRLIFLAKAYRVPMASTARALSLSRETLYQRLRRVTSELSDAVENGTIPGARPWPCRCGHPRLPKRAYCRRCFNAYQRTLMAQRRAGQKLDAGNLTPPAPCPPE